MARTAQPEACQAAQTYFRHINGVLAYVRRFLDAAREPLNHLSFSALESIVTFAAWYHDLGKLDDENQQILKGFRKSQSLPVKHWDAGTLYGLNKSRVMAAMLVYSHHRGLPNIQAESINANCFFREESCYGRTEQTIEQLISRHENSVGKKVFEDEVEDERIKHLNQQVLARTALSFLVDADFTDSSRPNDPLGNIQRDESPPLNPGERLASLVDYVNALKSDGERAALRRAVFSSCKQCETSSRIVACDSPVGSGKTTAIMAHLLSVAKERKLKRVFVVLPFTNIINQSVDVYRRALVLPSEDAKSIVAAVHHLVDYDNESMRDFSTRWDAPIVVTTAVAFFETLGSCSPSSLRRLHQILGSAIFVDEAHAALPARLLPIAWRWMKSFADDWNVHWVLASGSPVRFWSLPEVENGVRKIPELVCEEVRDSLKEYEGDRIKYNYIEQPQSIAELLARVADAPGPRLVILNTVQSAAVVANEFKSSYKFEIVFHLSTALTPIDREKTIRQVKNELDKNADGNWVLVGTSCVEAGLDFDFATGFREVSSLASLLQTGGRINRSGYRSDSVLYSFSMDGSSRLTQNRGLSDSICVVKEILQSGVSITPDLCTEALRRELSLHPGNESLMRELLKVEAASNFPEVEKKFRIIDADTRTVVINQKIIERLKNYERVGWKEVQLNSVQLWGYKIKNLELPEISSSMSAYYWNLKYDDFLGCMAGVVENINLFEKENGII